MLLAVLLVLEEQGDHGAANRPANQVKIAASMI